MMTIDPRLADRRREVAEDRARRTINRLLRILIVVAVLGAVVWLFLSPTLSVDTIDISGAHESAAEEILSAHQVTSGRPMIFVRAGEVEAELEADPWVRDAEVTLDWPGTVVVVVRERTPAAWVETSAGWSRRAVDGVPLPGPTTPDETMGKVLLSGISEGEAMRSDLVLGAIEFVDTLPLALGSEAVVELKSGELWATVSGFEVRLGRPTDMSDKALSLAALLDEGLAAGSQINMIAPTNPAVIPPPAEAVDGESEENGDQSDAGNEEEVNPKP